MRAAPAYLFDQQIELYAREDYGGRLRDFTDKVKIPARVDQQTRMKDTAGRRRRISYLHVVVPMSRRRQERTFVSARKVRVGTRKVGDVAGVSFHPMPGIAARMPMELEREEVIETVTASDVDAFYVGDRFEWMGLTYEIDDAYEHTSPRGPNSWEFNAHQIAKEAADGES